MKIHYFALFTTLFSSGFLANVVLTTSCSSSEIVSGQPSPVPKQSRNPPQWTAPSVLGLNVGSSVEADAKQLFGDASDKSKNRRADKVFGRDSEEELVLDFKNVKQANGHLSLILGVDSRIIKAVSIYPDNKMTVEDAITRFGRDFYQAGYSSLCISNDATLGRIDQAIPYPYALVFPNLGLVVDVRFEDNQTRVGRLDYLMKCP